MSDKANKRWAYFIGAGLALSPIHNQWLTDLATTADGATLFFLPAFATLMWLMGSLIFLTYRIKHWRDIDWGSKAVYIPLLVIVAAIGLSGFTADTLMKGLAPLFMAVTMFAVYLVSRTLGRDIFMPLAVGAAVASLGVIVFALMNPGTVTGGYIFELNYDVIVGYVLLGAAMVSTRWRAPLAALSLVGLFFTGSPEAVFVLGVLFLVVMVRRDWGKRLFAAAAVLLVVAGIWFALGYGQSLYQYTLQTVRMDNEVNSTEQEYGVTADTNIGYRFVKAAQAMRDLKPLGEGYNVTDFGSLFVVHNVPLVIVQQLGWPGILAGIAWLWVTIWCLVKTRLKYAFVLVLAASVFDHFFWTQMGPLWWVLIGVATAGGVKTDLLFKRNEDD